MTASIAAAAYYKRKITETLPVAVLLSEVMFFLLGLTGRISHIVGAYLLCIALADVVFCVFLYRRRITKGDILSVFDPGIAVWAVLVLLLIPLFLHAAVYNWDDFHYWAIYPKNMFEIDGAPNGAFACTEYKDYMRGIQFIYYFAFKIIGRFSEPAMFIVNNALIVTALMPFFTKGKSSLPRYVCSVAAGILIPYLSMFQMLHCLGVDCIMTVFFGYGLWSVYDEKKDLFYYVRIIAVMTALTVTKTAGLVFATVIFVVFFIKEKKKTIPVLSYLVPAAAAVLWKIYCINKGNTTYLHDIFEKNVTGGQSLSLPSYAPGVSAAFIRNFFTFRLNGAPLGMTPFVMMCLFVAAYIACAGKKKEDRYAFAAVMTGMALYLLSVLYTYLFVFVEWEAASLSSYDRYVSNYMGALLYAAAIIVIKRKIIGEKILAVMLAVCLVTLNYKLIYTQMYRPAHEREYAQDKAAKEDIGGQMQKMKASGVGQGERVMVVMPSDDEGLKLYAQYGAVPVNVGFYSAADADIEKLIEKAQNENMSYAYLTEGTSTGGFSGLEEGKCYLIENGSLSLTGSF